jgi:hypothetical protein
MSRLQKLRDMSPHEVARIHRVYRAIGNDNNHEKAIEAIADLIAYCGAAWPTMLQDALRRHRQSQRES